MSTSGERLPGPGRKGRGRGTRDAPPEPFQRGFAISEPHDGRVPPSLRQHPQSPNHLLYHPLAPRATRDPRNRLPLDRPSDGSGRHPYQPPSFPAPAAPSRRLTPDLLPPLRRGPARGVPLHSTPPLISPGLPRHPAHGLPRQRTSPLPAPGGRARSSALAGSTPPLHLPPSAPAGSSPPPRAPLARRAEIPPESLRFPPPR